MGPLLTKRLQEVFGNIHEISLEQLISKMDNQEAFYLIDVREDNEWREGSLPLAIHVSRGKLELNIESVTEDPAADIVLYCGGGTRSALAAESLQTMGYHNVKSLKGGFRGWKATGLPTEIQF